MAGIVTGVTGREPMKLPTLSISSLPDLDVMTGMYGSMKHADPAMSGSNDLIIVLMVYIYETKPPAQN